MIIIPAVCITSSFSFFSRRPLKFWRKYWYWKYSNLYKSRSLKSF